MSFSSPPANVFVNFLAAVRKPFLVPSGYMSPNDNLGFIWTTASGTAGSPQNLIGTVDGVNTIFTTPTAVVNGCAVYRNGILLDPAVSYSITGSQITFNAANIPQLGDDLMAIVS